ncbi:MAG: ABC transporter permease [Candidatus Dependentiae bacterium]|jgi:ABC-2 type transport system permease protein
MNRWWAVGKVLFAREWYRIRPDAKDLMINYYLVWPAILSLTSGYLAPVNYFGNDVQRATMLFSGMLLLQILILSYTNAMNILTERTVQPVVQYHVGISSLGTVYAVRFLFGVLYTTFLLIPFFPVSKLVLGSKFYTDEISWFVLIAAILMGSMLSMAYGLFLSTMVNSFLQIRSLWERFIQPALWLGGMWVPIAGFYETSPWLGYLSMINPFMYVTEAIRASLFPQGPYTPLLVSVAIITCATLFFITLSYRFMHQCLDAV